MVKLQNTSNVIRHITQVSYYCICALTFCIIDMLSALALLLCRSKTRAAHLSLFLTHGVCDVSTVEKCASHHNRVTPYLCGSTFKIKNLHTDIRFPNISRSGEFYTLQQTSSYCVKCLFCAISLIKQSRIDFCGMFWRDYQDETMILWVIETLG